MGILKGFIDRPTKMGVLVTTLCIVATSCIFLRVPWLHEEPERDTEHAWH